MTDDIKYIFLLLLIIAILGGFNEKNASKTTHAREGVLDPIELYNSTHR
jgi:hypothetical protein